MNPSPALQTIANVCVAIAAIIYALPLQYILLEFARKRNDHGAGTIIALFIVIPLWLLLGGALTCVTASGGFDWLRFSRPTLHALTLAATVSLALVSLLFNGMTPQSGLLERIAVCAPIYLFTLATMLLVVFSLNPGIAPSISPQVFRLPWIICAALSLMVCLGYGGYRLFPRVVGNVAGIAHRFGQRGPSSQDILAKISALDPQNDFKELSELSRSSKEVRDAAIALMRRNPDFIARLNELLKTGWSEPALDCLEVVPLTPEELKLVAPNARVAIQRFTEETESRFWAARGKKIPQKTAAQKNGRRQLKALAEKVKVIGEDFQPLLDAFEKAFEQQNN